MTALAPTLEREAIGPNLLGQFEDMLMAVVQHPAMLIYLNNQKSFGPDSRLGRKGRGLNENLAREIMELHTLGVDGGYSQHDVTELAKGITGWSVARPTNTEQAGFKFRRAGHQPGSRLLLGKSYRQQGIKQGEAMLRDLANHPATARFVCTKIVDHFISDAPLPSLVNKLVSTWQATQGNIKAVITTLINAEESWNIAVKKFKTPRELVISTFRALGSSNLKQRQLYYAMFSLGQQPFQAGSPAGYSDKQQDWDGGSALIARIDWTSMLSSRVKSSTNAIAVLKSSLGDSVSQHSYQMITRAESQQQALTLLLMSPEFQRR